MDTASRLDIHPVDYPYVVTLTALDYKQKPTRVIQIDILRHCLTVYYPVVNNPSMVSFAAPYFVSGYKHILHYLSLVTGACNNTLHEGWPEEHWHLLCLDCHKPESWFDSLEYYPDEQSTFDAIRAEAYIGHFIQPWQCYMPVKEDRCQYLP